MIYLVKMTPLEPYAFGTEQNAEYIGAEGTGKGTYFVRSKAEPEQTTILGMLRYMILEDQGLLKADFSYTPEERAKMKQCIGADSFSFSSLQKQDFGLIHEVSPLFLIDEGGHYYVKNPFHNKGEKGYTPLALSGECIETSDGMICLPVKGEYDAKKGHASGYYNLADGTVHKDLFASVIVTGNRKNGRDDQGEDSFFKRELQCLKEGFAFAVYVEADRLPARTVAYMGQKRSAFLVTTEVVLANDLAERVTAAFAGQADSWEYALSDLVVSGDMHYDSFAIVEGKRLQNLETVYDEKRHARRLRRCRKQYHLIRSGSVFHEHCPLDLTNENYRQIGYNQIVRLGGKQG